MYERPSCIDFLLRFYVFDLFLYYFFTLVYSCILTFFQNLSVLLAPVVASNILVIEALPTQQQDIVATS